MENLEFRYDLFALIIFMGLVQGVFLSIIFLARDRKVNEKYLGLLMLAFSLLLLDILLGYTGLMVKVIWFNNITESINFTLGPLFFLYFKSTLDLKHKHDWTHFIFPIFFFLYSLPYLLDSNEVKLYDYYSAMHPELLRSVPQPNDSYFDPFGLRSFVNQLTILSFLIYLVASALILFDKQYSSNFQINKLRFFWSLFLAAILILMVVKSVFGNDLGDHLVAAYLAITIYVTDFVFIKRYVEEKAKSGRYERSALSEEQKNELIEKINRIMIEEEYFKYPNSSLSELSGRLNSSSHYVSQAINEKLGKSYFELLAEHRINKACELLKENTLTTVEQVAFDVGYNSKSAFNKKFKELKGITPTSYRQST